MNQVLMVKIGNNSGASGLFINAKLIASTGGVNRNSDIGTKKLAEIAQAICVALNVSLVEVNFSEKFNAHGWPRIRDILLTRRVMRYRNAH